MNKALLSTSRAYLIEFWLTNPKNPSLFHRILFNKRFSTCLRFRFSFQLYVELLIECG